MSKTVTTNGFQIILLKLIALIFTVVAFSGAATADIKCKDDEDIKYEWQWCGTNKITHTNNTVTKVCVGTVTHTDIVYDAIQLNFKSKANQECLFATGSWVSVNEPKCIGAVRLFATIYGKPIHTVVKDCQKGGRTVKVEGVSATTLDQFSASR